MSVSRPSREELAAQYDDVLPLYEAFAARLKRLLEDLLDAADLDVVQVDARAKDMNSFLEKVERSPGKYPNPMTDIHDFTGARIVAYYLSDVVRIDEIIEREFEIDLENSLKGEDRTDPDRFGYASDHYVVSLPTGRLALAEWGPYAHLRAEIQIRTVLQHAWASIDHKLVYKRAKDIPSSLRRQLSRVSALLEVADEQFEGVRSASTRLEANYGSRARAGDLDLPINTASIRAYVESSERAKALSAMAAEAGFEIDDEHLHNYGPLTEAAKAAGFTNIGDVDGFFGEATSWAPQVLSALRKSRSPEIPWRMPTEFVLATLVWIGTGIELSLVREMTESDDWFIESLHVARKALEK